MARWAKVLDTQLGMVSNFNEVRFLTRLVHVTSACDQCGWLLGVSV